MAVLPSFQRPRFDLLCDVERPDAAIRCLPDLIQFNAVHNPDHTFALQSKQHSELYEFSFTPITFRELAEVVERCCNWILSAIPGVRPAQQQQDDTVHKSRSIALFMESDMGLFTYIAALLTLNIPCVLLSIRLSAAAVRQLVDETGATSIIVSPRTHLNACNALAGHEIKTAASFGIIEAAPFEDFLVQTSFKSQKLTRISACRQLVRENDRNVMILHSSGTTGLPKPIHLAHRYLLGYAACHAFPPNEDESKRGICLSTLPLFHGFGILAPCLALSVGRAFCLLPSTKIPTGSLVISLIRQRRDMTSMLTVPTILEEISHLPDCSSATKALSSLDFVAVGGGGLKPSIARSLASGGVTLLNHFGATELGALAPILRPTNDYDYSYLRLRTDLGLRLVRQSVNNDENDYTYRLTAQPFAWNVTFELQDRLEVNPLKPDLEIKIVGRKDDVIVLATGEKVLPSLMEQALEQDPLVSRAVVFGQGQFEIGILIEPASSAPGSQGQLVDAIWPTILQTNKLMDGHARIYTKTAVLIKSSDKTIPLTDKGSVKRQDVYKVFDSEIRAFYELQEKEPIANAVLDHNNLLGSLRLLAQSCLPVHVQQSKWTDDNDLIHLGMDSLQAVRLRRLLSAGLCQARQFAELPLDFVYAHPSVSSLVEAIRDLGELTPPNSILNSTMTDLVQRYILRNPEKSTQIQKSVILLTGSTGSLGSYLLQALSMNPKVECVICLMRAKSSSTSHTLEDFAEEQSRALKNRGIELPQSTWSKVSYLQWTPGADFLGLEKKDYWGLASSITHVFHGAWPMDFNRKLRSFEDQIKSVQDLLKVCHAAHSIRPQLKPRIMVVSSIAAVGRYPSMSGRATVPEVVDKNPEYPLPMGYAEAKWVCEQVVSHEYQSEARHKVQPTIARIGQISGSQYTGAWSMSEHFPALVRASQAVDALPELSGTLSWLPVDRAARIVVDILLRPGDTDLVYNIENPIRQSWPDVCTIIARKLGLSKRLPFDSWIEQIARHKEVPEGVLDFFRNHFLHMSGGTIVLDTRTSRAASSTLQSTGAVSKELIELYLDFWKNRKLSIQGR